MSQESAPAAPPQPTEEHKKLMESVGVWNVDCTFFMDPSQPPMKVQGKETVEAFGDFWTVSLFEAEMFGAPFRGRTTFGYDPSIGKWVSTWVDTFTPALYHLQGSYDASGKKLEMSGEGFDCSSGGQTTYRTVEEHHDDGTRTFEMFMNLPDGSECKLFTHEYTRAR